ncbi:hypothetical protein BZG36_05569, partial [Bifiguratus adelaidae]
MKRELENQHVARAGKRTSCSSSSSTTSRKPTSSTPPIPQAEISGVESSNTTRQTTPEPSADPPKPNVTPKRRTSASIETATTKGDTMRQDIQHELIDAIRLATEASNESFNVFDAVKLLVQKRHLVPPKGSSLQKAINDPSMVGWRWRQKPDPFKDQAVADFLNQVCACLNGQSILRSFATPEFRAAYPLLYGYEHGREDLRPDFILLPKEAWLQVNRCQELNQAFNNYQKCIVVGECKFTDVNEARWQLYKYIRGLKRSQLWRRFAVGVYITQSTCGVVRADQSGIEYTDFAWSETSTDVIKFVRLLNWLSVGSLESFGFDNTFALVPSQRHTSRPPNGKTIRTEYTGCDIASITCGSTKYLVDSLLYNGVAIRGRGTKVFRVHNEDDTAKANPKALKIMWQDTGRVHNEAYFHELARSRGVQNVLLADETCHYTLSDTINGIRGFDSVGGYCRKFHVENRQETRLVLPYHQPLKYFKDLDDLVRGLLGAIKGHRSLYEASILHRDVSERNVLLNGSNGLGEGWLIDLDMACLVEDRDDQAPSTPEPDSRKSRKRRGGPLLDGTPPRKKPVRRESDKAANETADLYSTSSKSAEESEGFKGPKTGTVPYMACGVLRGEEHSLKHDLESFFYVLYLIPFTYDTPFQGRQSSKGIPEVINNWCRGDLQQCGDLKKGVMGTPDRMLRLLTEQSAKGWRDEPEIFTQYLGLLWKLWKVLLPVAWAFSFDSTNISHEDIIQPL